ncbi:thioredoxin family protein [Flavobacterium agrisoli]|uniref:Thioredoxin family protein n=1 Tax=Flavobacterium agrisoli TaxID=2793066 RepID=A0A934PM18_9FLAO|nr:thioredoxin family protein [Flavobacterium agrisoli]MBK0370677.1 thioredoxin family protein [Flavobacterium agrisoli]
MNKTLLFLLFIFSGYLHAQGVEWKTNINDAIVLSSKTRKPMLILFTANNLDRELQSQVFNTYDFTDWAKKEVILVRLDLSDSALDEQTKEDNMKLKNAFGVNQIPTVCYTKANFRNNKTTFQFMGKVIYDHKGLRSWMNQSENVLNHEEITD